MTAIALCVVDDEQSFISLATYRLAKAGLDVIGVGSHDEAIDLLDGRPEIRLVLLDQDLSTNGGSTNGGSELTRAIRSASNGSRILLALTSSVRPSDREAFREAGADGYVAKADLAGVVNEIVALADGYTIAPTPAIELFNDRLTT